VKRLKELERESSQLKRAVADLTLDKLILKEAAEGNFKAQRAGGRRSVIAATRWASRNAGPVRSRANRARRNGINPIPRITRSR
jgi:hypothetical protein